MLRERLVLFDANWRQTDCIPLRERTASFGMASLTELSRANSMVQMSDAEEKRAPEVIPDCAFRPMHSLSHTAALLDYFRQARLSLPIELQTRKLRSMSAQPEVVN